MTIYTGRVYNLLEDKERGLTKMTMTAELIALINWMVTTYHAHSASDEYWFAFIIDHLTYVVPHMTFDELARYFKPGYTSHKKGHKFVLRIKASASECRELLPRAILIGEEGILTRRMKNAGDGLEQILSERFGDGEWTKHDSTPFDVAGDLRIDGKEVQVKLNNATLTTENYLKLRFG